MNKWSDMMNNKVFITDLGEAPDIAFDEEGIRLGRFAVWSPLSNSQNHQIIEVGEDLQELRKKYNIPQERICVVFKQ